MATTVIVKNNTGASVFIEDMGIAVPGSSQIIFSDIFDFTDICESADLKTYVGDSTFIINDGVSDLNVSDGLDYISCKSSSETGPHSIFDHTDVDNPISPINEYRLVYNEITGKWEPNTGNIDTESTDPPDSTSTIWIYPVEGLPMFWDPTYGEWLSVSRSLFLFSKDGKTDGSYLRSGDVHSGYFYIHRPAKLTHVYFKHQDGSPIKTIEIHNSGSSIYSFNLVDSLYVSDLDIDVDVGDEIQVWVVKDGEGEIKKMVSQIEIAWRYVE